MKKSVDYIGPPRAFDYSAHVVMARRLMDEAAGRGPFSERCKNVEIQASMSLNMPALPEWVVNAITAHRSATISRLISEEMGRNPFVRP